MEGLFVVIFIAIGIFSSVMKQQKQNHGSGGRNMQRQYRQKPVQRQKHIPQQLERTFMDLEKSWGEMLGSAEEYVPAPVFAEKVEGIEAEDRSRVGSLDYVEQLQSSEGVCNEHPEHRQQKRQEKKAAPKAEIAEREEGKLEFTEENLLRSIVMAEILGPPRALKRNIR